MTEIQKELFAFQDKKYGDFSAKLNPGVPRESVIGVRVPKIRILAKKLYKEKNYQGFLRELPHRYFEENMLHGLIVESINDYDECVEALEKFLPFIDNWAVCDSISPKVFKKHKKELILKIYQWVNSGETYTARFGLKMLMSHFLDEGFKKEYLDLAAGAEGEDYYLKMMVAWFFATALAKQWEETVSYIENYSLEEWVHNKTISKARESYRISREQKEYLNKFKIKDL